MWGVQFIGCGLVFAFFLVVGPTDVVICAVGFVESWFVIDAVVHIRVIVVLDLLAVVLIEVVIVIIVPGIVLVIVVVVVVVVVDFVGCGGVVNIDVVFLFVSPSDCCRLANFL